MPSARPASGNKLSMGCGYAVFVFLLAAGSGLLYLAARDYPRYGGRWDTQWGFPTILGTIFVVGAMGYLVLARRLVRESEAEAARRAQFPDQPWKWKKEWLGPAIAPKEGGVAVGLWVFAGFWNLLSWAGVAALWMKGSGKPGEYFILLFPAVGLLLLWAAIYNTIRWRKFGRVRFVPASLPGVIGGYLGGVIDVPVRVSPEGDAKLTLKCVRREVRGSGKQRRTTAVVLWEREESIAREKWVTGAGPARLPVMFYIPATCVATDDSDPHNAIVWRLAASAAVPGVDFGTEFEVPVFATGETAAPPEAGAPVLPEYRAVMLDAAALRACGVRREGGTFHFSSSHLPGTKATTAILQMGIFGLLAWFWGRDIPFGAWAITIFFGLILSLFTVGVWCDKFELRIEGAEVVLIRPRPWGTKVIRVPRAEVKAVEVDRSMSSGNNQYYGLNLVGTDGVNPGSVASEAEPFRVRKLRYQLAQVAKGAGTRSKDDILAEMKIVPKFSLRFASYIPGQAKSEAVGAMVMQAIREK